MDLETNPLVFFRQYPLILCHHWDLKYLGPESDWHTIRLAKQIGRACGQSSSPFLRSAFIRKQAHGFLGEAVRYQTRLHSEPDSNPLSQFPVKAQCVCVPARSLSCVWLCSPPGSSVHGFSKQEYWSGLPLPSPGDLPDSGIELASPMTSALAGGFFYFIFFTTEPPGKPVKSESEVTQSCPTLCDPMNCSLPGSSVHGIFQARVLEWVAIAFSRGSSGPRDRTRVSCIAGGRFTVWASREAKGSNKR